jgi:hypothetical protein
MTTDELIDYYANLLIIQYVGKPKAFATIQATVALIIMDQLPTQVMNAYNLIGTEPAEGVQLDVLGKYAGVRRTGSGITLDDTNFLSLIRMAIARNNSGSSLADIQNILNTFFPGQVIAFDYQNMHMSYLISSAVGNQDLIKLFISEGLLPKPMGVALSVIIYAPVISMFFGFCQYDVPVNPFATPYNSYADYQTDWPWMSYKNVFTV